jgi:tRNA(fMet)-specific endonuclease VapC
MNELSSSIMRSVQLSSQTILPLEPGETQATVSSHLTDGGSDGEMHSPISRVLHLGVPEPAAAFFLLRTVRTGVAKSSSPARSFELVDNLLDPLGVAEFASADVASYAEVRARLELAGTPIGPLDTLVAAQVVARNVILVSNNEREFSRVTGLRVENWAS